MHLPIHDRFLIILSNLWISFCAELVIYRLNYSLSKLIQYMSIFYLILYFLWNPPQLEDVFIFISLWYLSFSKYFALSVSVFGTAV